MPIITHTNPNYQYLGKTKNNNSNITGIAYKNIKMITNVTDFFFNTSREPNDVVEGRRR